MSLAILFHFLCAQHVSDINISIIRSLQLCCWITTLVILFLVRCVLEFRCGQVGVGSVLQGWSCASACNMDTTQAELHQIFNTQQTENTTTNVVLEQQSCKLLMMDILMSETCWAHKKWNKKASDIKLVFYSSTMMNLFCSAQERLLGVLSAVCSNSNGMISVSVKCFGLLHTRNPSTTHARVFF